MNNPDTTDLAPLTRLLRTQMSAVHRQFIHILALRVWQREDLADPITAVDSEDFKNAMQIIDWLVVRGLPIELGANNLAPGWDIGSILQAELRLERDFLEVPDALEAEDPEALARLERAAAPRRAHIAWIEQQEELSADTRTAPATGAAMTELVTQLIALIEQAMLHAFLHWHRGEGRRADDGWRISGAAMLYGAALVRLKANRNAVPSPVAVAPVQLVDGPGHNLDRDLSLVRHCASLARTAAGEEEDDALRLPCLRMAEDCDRIAGMQPGADFPAELGRSPVFESFEASRARSIA